MELSSIQMRTSGLSFGLLNVFIHVVIIFCWMDFLQPGIVAAGTVASGLGGNETDLIALLEFKAKVVEDPLQVMSSWNSTVHFCNWPGVTCGRRHHQRVTVLDLQSRKLVGSISRHIGNLSFLRSLILQNNSFRGGIPLEIDRLRRLQVLALHNNSLSGEIPTNLSSCSYLLNLYLSTNKLVGKIPPELGALSKLESIIITTNNLTGGIPPAFGNLSRLKAFDASENKLVGSIPEALCQSTKLKYLVVRGNSLSGMIPPSLFNHSSIVAIDVGNNFVEGSLPPQFGITLPNLEFFSIRRNNLTGSIPPSMANSTNLKFFIAGRNGLTGKVPTLEKLQKIERFLIAFNSLGSGEADDLNFISSLKNATNLELLELNQNHFGGMLPESIGNLSTKLAELSLSSNQISGSIPAGIFNLVNLGELYLATNRLTGQIPPEIGRLQKLQHLALLENKFSGSIPNSFGNLTLLTRLSLAVNKLNGSIPANLGKCQNLELLDLSCNNLSGTIPKEVFDLSSLSLVLNLSQNHLTGSLPVEVGNLINLGCLDISENKLAGEIPVTLGRCVLLETLYLQANFFQGTIPLSLRSLRGIQVLDLSHNNLSGEIPKFLGGFDFLQNLNLSFNDLVGEVLMEGIFKNASAISIMGNVKLCGGVSELRLPMCKFERDGNKSNFRLKHIISLSCGLLGAILVVWSMYLFWFWKKKKEKEPDSVLPEHSLLRTSYQDLLKATHEFSSANLIGNGSFGSVYKGVMNDGTIIAVKVLNLLHRGAFKSFVAECEALRRIRHRNLVKVLTACSGADYQGNDFKALVYEFMVNGNLDAWLHPNLAEHVEYDKLVHLNLHQRLNIAIDVASALDYLHHDCGTPIVHCDLKPSNVLLDSKMTAHVGDFGLAKFLFEASSTSSAIQTSSIGVRGSVGYTAPEYGMGSDVSTYGDTYSFGILLLEMLTGKRPTDEMFIDNLNLHDFAKIALCKGVEGIADPVLLQQGEEGETSNAPTVDSIYQGRVDRHKILETLAASLRIGIACSAESPRERLDMKYVVTELCGSRDALLGLVAGGRHGMRRTTAFASLNIR